MLTTVIEVIVIKMIIYWRVYWLGEIAIGFRYKFAVIYLEYAVQTFRVLLHCMHAGSVKDNISSFVEFQQVIHFGGIFSLFAGFNPTYQQLNSCLTPVNRSSMTYNLYIKTSD